MALVGYAIAQTAGVIPVVMSQSRVAKRFGKFLYRICLNCLEALAAEKPIKSGMRNLAIDCGQELATYAGIGIVTVHQLENGITQPRHATWDVVSGAFEATGVPFIDANERGGPAVRLKEPQGIKRSE